MTTRLSNNGRSPLPYAPLHWENLDVTWAGPNPLQPGFCFGSADGRLLLTDEAGLELDKPRKGSMSGEAINGVARFGEWLAVSTRGEITIWSLHQDRTKRRGAVVVPRGAHGIAAAPGGYFLAPLGNGGIMLVQAGSSPSDPVGVLGSDKPGMYFSRVIAWPGTNGGDVLACAARRGGIGVAELRWGQKSYNMRVATFDDLDVVDMCAICSDSKTPAVAGLGLDGSLILIRDPLHDETPVTMKFNTVQGTAYRVLSSGEHLLILTSRGLYLLEKLAGRLLAGLPPGKFITHITTLPVEAVDANVVADRWLLVITPDVIQKSDLTLLGQSTPNGSGNGESEEQAAHPRNLAPAWQTCGVSQQSSLLAAV